MLQLRLEAELLLENQENVLKIDHWEEIVKAEEYKKMHKKVTSENVIVRNELK